MSKILIVEDEIAIRRVLIKILAEENSDFIISEAPDGLIPLTKSPLPNFSAALARFIIGLV